MQVEASRKVKEIFPNLADVPAVDLTTGGDGGARDVGAEDKEAVTQPCNAFRRGQIGLSAMAQSRECAAGLIPQQVISPFASVSCSTALTA